MRVLQVYLLFFVLNSAFASNIDFDKCFSTITGSFGKAGSIAAEFAQEEASAIPDLITEVKKICDGCNLDCGFLDKLTTKDEKAISCVAGFVDVLSSAEAAGEEGINVIADYDVFKSIYETVKNCIAIFKSSSSSTESQEPDLCTAFACATCESNGTCTSCVPGFSMINQTCTQCPEFCETCEAGASNFLEPTCNSCFSGYALLETYCLECPSNCSSCSASLQDNGLYVTKCDDSDSTDDQEPDLCTAFACATCESNGTCTSCEPGFFMNNQTCAECPQNCETCEAGASVFLEPACNSCFSGYALLETYCVECPSKCSSCSATLQANGLYVTKCDDSDSTDDQEPDLCTAFACATCESNGTCTSCVPGFFMNNQTCAECPQNCETCEAGAFEETICNSCFSGYALLETYCVECPSKCSSCSASLQDNGLYATTCNDTDDSSSDSSSDSSEDSSDDDSDALTSALSDLSDA